MKNKAFIKYYILSVISVFAVSFYPLYMGVSVVWDMITQGTVYYADYPKYIIPYTPISLAVIFGVLLMPLLIKLCKRFALLAGTGLALLIFYISELILESQVIVTSTVESTLESWQMYMCYVSPEQYQTRTWTAIDVLIGDYSPTFKIHFYVISMVVIISLLNCFYGFAQMICSGNKQRLRTLIAQAAASVLFLGLCIWACFTAFYRTGEVYVSVVSAVLMSVFFVVIGVTSGLYTGSFFMNRRNFAIAVSAVASSAVTFVMYIGEMFLLSGNLYRFGTGILFEPLGRTVLAPFDIMVILISGVMCGVIMAAVSKQKAENKN